MSHIVEIQTKVRDEIAARAACKRLGLKEPTRGTFKLFNVEATGLAVELPGWRYPAVCDLDTGDVRFDTYQGKWGEEQQLHRFLQTYAVEKTKLEARKQGYTVTEQSLKNGSVKLNVITGGQA
ncbi:MAG: DUF1257 domain-containing protein [Planctomycetales bacterium]